MHIQYLTDDDAPSSRCRWTIAEMGSRPLSDTRPTAIHWPMARSPEPDRTDVRKSCALNRTPPAGPMVPAKRHTHRVSRAGKDIWVSYGPRVLEDTHKADPIWGTAFRPKFTKRRLAAPDAPLVTPRGRTITLDTFLERAERAPTEELQFLIDTQFIDLPTTLAEFKSNALDAVSLSPASDEDMEAANIADIHLRQTPFAVRLPDELMPDPETGEPVPVARYGDMRYVAATQRIIDWERWRDACGRVNSARFVAAKDGTVSVEARGPDRDPDHVLALKQKVARGWFASHGSLPTHVPVATTVITGPTPKEDEDRDPFRATFHADLDPKPQREHYPFGECIACNLRPESDPEVHRDCEVLGWQLYRWFNRQWELREEARGEVGYAGPTGLLGTDVDDASIASFA